VRRRVFALFRKELRSLFASPIAYVVLTAFVSLSAIFFFQHAVTYNRLLFVFQGADIGAGSFDPGTPPRQLNVLEEVFVPTSGDLSLLLLALVPLVTMRVFAEEKLAGTDELLLTTPLRPWEVAFAKHAACWLFVALMLGVSALFPAVAVEKGKLGLEHLLALYTGMLGYGVALAGIGLACSSLTQSQIVAAVLAYAIPFVLLDFGWIEPVASEGLAALLATLALQERFESFARGLIELRHLLYFGALALAGWVVSLASLELGRAR
jgi:ABC-2 type transport system permease protein